MTTSDTLSIAAALPSAQTRSLPVRLLHRWWPLLVFLLLLGIGWEATKLVGGQAIKIDTVILGQTVQTTYKPPLKFKFANDLNLPHLWDIVGALGRPAQRGGPPLLLVLLDGAFFTFRVALVGFALGSSLGLLLAVLLIRSKLLNRALVPFIVASQTIPILVIAPMVVIWLRAGWFSIAIIAAYLSFFPVTVSALRGLRAFSPEMLDLLQTYAASPLEIIRHLRVPAAMPYLFVGFKIAATASIIGTIVGELPSGISEGLGSLVLTFAQYYSTGPAKLWACILVVAGLGITTFLIVQVIEMVALRNYPRRPDTTA
ncbi:MAG: ABC transporter permease subunit [Anaerolineae bacterium]